MSAKNEYKLAYELIRERKQLLHSLDEHRLNFVSRRAINIRLNSVDIILHRLWRTSGHIVLAAYVTYDYAQSKPPRLIRNYIGMTEFMAIRREPHKRKYYAARRDLLHKEDAA